MRPLVSNVFMVKGHVLRTPVPSLWCTFFLFQETGTVSIALCRYKAAVAALPQDSVVNYTADTRFH